MLNIKNLEKLALIGAGVQPKIPVKGSYFVDLSQASLEKIKNAGGFCQQASAERLPFRDSVFDIVCAFHVIEHAKKDEEVLKEISRILKQDGTFIFSVPLHAKYWSSFDEIVGHKRRYEPRHLERILRINCFYADKYKIHVNSHYLLPYKLLCRMGGFLMRCIPELVIQILSNKLYFPLVIKLGRRASQKWETGSLASVDQEAVGVVVVTKKIF